MVKKVKLGQEVYIIHQDCIIKEVVYAIGDGYYTGGLVVDTMLEANNDLSGDDTEYAELDNITINGETYLIPKGGATLYKHFIKFSFQSKTSGATYHGFIELISSDNQQIGTQAELYQALNKQEVNICYVNAMSIISVEDATRLEIAFMKAYSNGDLQKGDLYWGDLNQGAPMIESDVITDL